MNNATYLCVAENVCGDLLLQKIQRMGGME